MPSATLTSKGQITIPKEVRDELGLRVGDRVAFRTLQDGRVIVEPETIDLRELRGVLKPRRTGVTLAQMEAAIHAEVTKR
jgi:AbrB family looped-hinge helix DNA binding protein